LFFDEKKKSYPSIENDLKQVINSLTELWILKEEQPFLYSLQHRVFGDSH